VKWFKHSLVLLLSVALVFSLVGCGGEATPAPEPPEGEEEEKPSQPPERRSITILTYGSGGSNYIQAGGIVKVAEKYMENTVATVQPTGGDLEMIRLLDQRKGDFAFVMLNSAFQAYNGGEPFDKVYDDVRTFLVGQSAMMHLVVPANSSIQSVPDLKGKRVSIGTPGSSCANYMTPRILEAFGMTLDDIRPQQISMNDTVAALKDGTLDAGFFYLIPPAPAITDLSSTHPIRLLPITPEAQAHMAQADPLLDFAAITKETYSGMEADTMAVGLSCVIVTHKDVPEDVIYDMAKALDEHMADWVEVHYGAEFYTPEKTAKYAFVPVHPGMKKYMDELGISVD